MLSANFWKPELPGAHQVSDEPHRILDDRVERVLGLGDVRHHPRGDDRDEDLEQAEHLLPAHVPNSSSQVEERRADLPEGVDDRDDVLERERPDGLHDPLRDRADESHQARQRTLEPREGAGHGIAALDVLPDLLLADQLHEAADQRLGGARYRLAGDRVLPEDRLEQVVAARALGQRGQRPQDRVLDQGRAARRRRRRRTRSDGRSGR